jgi:predicted dehydrogenase
MKKQTKLGVVGCGYWGPNLIRNFRSLPECSVRLMCDLDQRRLDRLKCLYPEVGTTDDFNHLLNGADLDAVAIATPVRFHHAMAKAALLAGKHTFIEKPMARTSAECEELIALAAEKGLVLMVGHTFLYSAPVRKIRQIVRDGDIGDIQYICSRRLNLGLFQKDINVVWDLAPHDISIILYIMEEFPTSVNCRGNCHITPGIEDVTSMSLSFRRDRFAIIQNSWLDPRKVREMTIVGTKRMIVYDDLETLEKIKIYDTRVETPPHYNTFAEFHYSYHYGDIYAPFIHQEEPVKVECAHFLDCIRAESDPLTGGVQGLELVRILEAASDSLRKSGAAVELPLHAGNGNGNGKFDPNHPRPAAVPTPVEVA